MMKQSATEMPAFVPGTVVKKRGRWFAAAPGYTSPLPFVWDEARRARLRAELDALYGHLYGLTREELAYILERFPIVRRKDEAQYGEYRTKRMVLEAFKAKPWTQWRRYGSEDFRRTPFTGFPS